jgi:D-threo-aldose 1-dehydrogenase
VFEPFNLNQEAVARVGLGCAAIGHREVTEVDARGCVETAWEGGIRYLDTAPMYGAGLSEYRVGRALSGQPRDTFVISSKVGRLVDDPGPDGVGTSFSFDFTADGIRRSVDASLRRLGMDRIDILFIHDPDAHWETAINEAWPVLEELRSQGVVRAVGAGMTQAPMLARFARETSMDLFLLAGRYSLLDRDALAELFPVCVDKGMGVLVAQSMHGGLIDGVPNPMLYYRPVDDETRAKVSRIAAICHAHGIPTAAAAIQFPLGYPAVKGVLTGPASAAQARQNLSWLATTIPPQVWADLKAEGLLESDTPVPM